MTDQERREEWFDTETGMAHLPSTMENVVMYGRMLQQSTRDAATAAVPWDLAIAQAEADLETLRRSRADAVAPHARIVALISDAVERWRINAGSDMKATVELPYMIVKLMKGRDVVNVDADTVDADALIAAGVDRTVPAQVHVDKQKVKSKVADGSLKRSGEQVITAEGQILPGVLLQTNPATATVTVSDA